MALIKCPKCGREMSDRAAKCPQCGTSIEEIKTALHTNADNKESVQKPRKWLFVIVAVAVFVIMAIVFLPDRNNDNSDVPEGEAVVSTVIAPENTENDQPIISLDGEWILYKYESMRLRLFANMSYDIAEEGWAEYAICDDDDNIVEIRDTTGWETNEMGTYKINDNTIIFKSENGSVSRGSIDERGGDINIIIYGSGEEGDMDAVYVPCSKIKVKK